MLKEVFVTVNSILTNTRITIEGFSFSLLEYITCTGAFVIAAKGLSKLFDD